MKPILNSILFFPLLLTLADAQVASAPSTEILGAEKDYTAFNATASSIAVDSVARELNARSGLPNVFGKLQRNEPVTIAYYGGSITASSGWRTLTFDWFKKTFPKAPITMLSASVGGSGSLVGVFRADHDLIARKPDLVFIEFSLNDIGDVRTRPAEVAGALEGIIRKLLTANPHTDICLTYVTTEGDMVNLNQGKLSTSVALHDRIATAYALPSIVMGMQVARRFAAHELVFMAPSTPNHRTADGKPIFTHDGSHPTENGHALYAEAVIRSLEKLRASTTPLAHPLPPALSRIAWEKATSIPVDGNAAYSGTWEKLTAANGPSCRRFGKTFYEWFPFLYRTSAPGSSLTVHFRGTHIGLKGMECPDSGIVSIKIDDRPPVEKTLFSVYASQTVYVGEPLPELPAGNHVVTWTLMDKSPPKEAMLAQKNNDQDFRAHPEKYAANTFSAGQIILIGDILHATAHP